MCTQHMEAICFTSMSSHILCHSSPPGRENDFLDGFFCFCFRGTTREQHFGGDTKRLRQRFSAGLGGMFVLCVWEGTFDNVRRQFFGRQNWEGDAAGISSRDAAKDPTMHRAAPWPSPSPRSTAPRQEPWRIHQALCAGRMSHIITLFLRTSACCRQSTRPEPQAGASDL